MTDQTVEPQVLEEPRVTETTDKNENIWMRGLFMLILIVLFGVAEFLLALAAIIQFFWMLIGKEKNEMVADFGKDLAAWLAKVAEFQTGVTEEKPFPFARQA